MTLRSKASENSGRAEMIGMHAIIYSTAAEKDRKFLSDVLGLASVDAGEGWLILALPPSEIAVHPDKKGGYTELYFMCRDIKSTLAALRRKRVKVVHDVSDQGWVARIGCAPERCGTRHLRAASPDGYT